MKRKETKSLISTWVTTEEKDRLISIAGKEDWPVSILIRKIIRQYLSNDTQKEEEIDINAS